MTGRQVLEPGIGWMGFSPDSFTSQKKQVLLLQIKEMVIPCKFKKKKSITFQKVNKPCVITRLQCCDTLPSTPC